VKIILKTCKYVTGKVSLPVPVESLNRPYPTHGSCAFMLGIFLWNTIHTHTMYYIFPYYIYA